MIQQPMHMTAASLSTAVPGRHGNTYGMQIPTMNVKSGYDLGEDKSQEAEKAYQRDQLVEESFDRIKGQIKLETRNKIDQLFDAAEAGD